METHEDFHRVATGRCRADSPTSLRFTPQSSNSSSANLPHLKHTIRSDRDRIRDREHSGNGQGLASGSLLQERLREKKAARLSEQQKSMDVASLCDEKTGPQISSVSHGLPSQTAKDPDFQRPSSGNKTAGERAAGKKNMGLKEMEEVIQSSNAGLEELLTLIPGGV